MNPEHQKHIEHLKEQRLIREHLREQNEKPFRDALVPVLGFLNDLMEAKEVDRVDIDYSKPPIATVIIQAFGASRPIKLKCCLLKNNLGIESTLFPLSEEGIAVGDFTQVFRYIVGQIQKQL